MRPHFRYLLIVLSWTTLLVAAKSARAQDDVTVMPTLKFFYYDQGNFEWAVSAETDRFQNHLAENSVSAGLYTSLQASVAEQADLEQVKSSMTSWIANQRDVTSPSGSRAAGRQRIAEGVVAYMRAHDFEVSKLVAALLKRSSARDVELVALHLVDEGGNSSFKLKVILPYDEIQIDRQGFDVVLRSPEVTYTSVAYALGLALYEVHEILNGTPSSESGLQDGSEELPMPGPLTPLSSDMTGAQIRASCVWRAELMTIFTSPAD